MPNKIKLAERILLPTLRFDLEIFHPYKLCGGAIKSKLTCEFLTDSIHLHRVLHIFNMKLICRYVIRVQN
jgi:hypothetical protein